MICEICEINEARNHVCNGDGRYHGGAVHTYLRGDTNDLAYLCDSCYKKDSQAWQDKRKEMRQ